MFHSSSRTMKWGTLLKDIKEKVGLSHFSSSLPTSVPHGEAERPQLDGVPDSAAREKHELELGFKRNWELFRSSSSEKEKEDALNMAVDIFCRLVKRQMNVPQVINMLVEPHIFSFVIGRAFVSDVEKLKSLSKTRSLHVSNILDFFINVTKGGINPGLNLLCAVQALVSGPLDKQPLLDSGILSCLIHILNALLCSDDVNDQPNPDVSEVPILQEKARDANAMKRHQLEVEGIIVHVMKALASQPSAALSLTEDDSLQMLFHMVATGSLAVFSKFRMGLIPLHTIQLHRHAMQILGLLLVNDNGSAAKYIHKHYLIKVLLTAVKDFNPEIGDSAYTMGIVDLLLECVELSYRTEAGGIRLREDIHNAHGYQFLVQFALILSALQKNQVHSVERKLASEDFHSSDGRDASHETATQDSGVRGDLSPSHLSPSLSRLLDVLVNLSQTGPAESTTVGGKGPKPINSKATGHGSRSSADRIEDIRERDSTKVKDLEAIQMLQDIFLKADNVDLQAEVLNRMFKIFSSHIENYKICQELRTVPLFILNMAGFPMFLQEKILKILEYAVTVINCVPEQELLSLCCLLQQPITAELKHSILAFFIKLLSFDQQYKRVLREVGVLEVMLDDIKCHKYLSGAESPNISQTISASNSFTRHKDNKYAILSSPNITEPRSGKFRLFEDEGTIAAAWDCLVSLLKKAEANQSSFRLSNGSTLVLPFLASDTHRSGVLRLLTCLITEDVKQAHPEELGALIEILKSGMITSLSGSQYKLHYDAKCDTLGTLWRILGANHSAQRVFGEATGFSLLLTMLHSLHREAGNDDSQPSLMIHMKIFCFLVRVMTAGVYNNSVNRISLHSVISSQAFYELFCESGLLSVDYEKQVIQLLLELALEIVLPPQCVNLQQAEGAPFEIIESGPAGYFISSSFRPEKEGVYNAGAIIVLIRSLLKFTPKVQLDLLSLMEKLAHAGPFNQENLTSAGCVGLLLETIHPFLFGSSSLLSHALRVVQALGSYRLSSAELRILVRYILQSKLVHSGYSLVGMMKNLIDMEEMTSENIALAPFVEMGMSKIGHSSIQVSLGERTWPPAAGYSFVCWFWFTNLMRSAEEKDQQSKSSNTKRMTFSGGQNMGKHVLRIFSVGTIEDVSSFYAELYLQDDGVFTLSTSNSCSLSFPSVELEENRWHHLAVVHSKPNALAGLFQASVAYLYLDGKLRHTGKLGYSPSPIGKQLQVTIGTPISCAKISDLSWRMRCCYLYEEVLTSGGICFMYLLGRKYRGLFQDADLLQFVPNEACGGGNMAILDSLDAESPVASNTQRTDTLSKQGSFKSDGSCLVWDLERLSNLSLQLSGKKLIFAFDGTSESFRTSGMLSILNLVDPMSAAASPIGGIPRFGRLHGDISICSPCVIGDSVRAVGGITVVLALVEAANTRDMLHMALCLLASALHQNPQNVQDMQVYRGYHLLALFLHRRMALFDMQSLNIFFQIAAREASLSEKQKAQRTQSVLSNRMTVSEATCDDDVMKFDELSSVGSHGDLMEDFAEQKDLLSNITDLENADLQQENSNCVVLSNADMVEHVLLDWTVWVTAPIPIQIALLGFLEHLVSMHWYRNHNLTILRQINLVQHLLVTLQRGDVEVSVLEKLVVLLGVILEDGFLVTELELVVKFVIMTFDPPELTQRRLVTREAMGKHVIVRNMLLEMLIDLQVTIKSEELLEQWHKIVSSKLITYFLDEAVHPTSMKWVMTLLGVCLSSSPTFALKFRNSGGFQGLARVLPSFYDSPEIYYTLFCLIFGKAVYPRLPEVRMLDFHALIPSYLNHSELKFVDLLESVISMAKATFDRLSLQSMLAYQAGVYSQFSASLAVDLIGGTNMGGELQGEALLHKTYAARLMGGEAAAPVAATSVLRFMVDLAKMCHPFSAICRRPEFLESCVDLYFSSVRAASALKMAKNMSVRTLEDKNLNDSDDTHSSQNTFSSLLNEQEQSAKASITVGSLTQGQISTSSEDLDGVQNVTSADYDYDKVTTADDGDKETTLADDGDKETTLADDGDKETTLTDDGDKETTLADDGDKETTLADDGDKETTLADDGDKETTLADDGDKETTLAHVNSDKPFMGDDEHANGNILGQLPGITFNREELAQQSNEVHGHVQQRDSLSPVSIVVPDSPALSEKSNFKMSSLTPTSSPVIALASWFGSVGHSDGKVHLPATPSMSSVSGSELEASQDAKSSFQESLVVNMLFTVTPQLLLEMDDAGSGGGPCSASATAVLDFIAEVLADILTEQIKAAQVIEAILETVPLYVDAESALVFQGLCLSRLMNFLERRLLRDDEELEKKLDKSRWSLNLDTICWMIVDRVYMGAFPRPSGVLRTLEFLLSMLQFSNKDGRIQDTTPTGKGLLSIARGSKQLEAYIHSLLKNTNRMIMYCFLPSFLNTIGEHDFLSRIGFQIEPNKNFLIDTAEDSTSSIDVCTVLQLLIAHQRLIICPSNIDSDLICCLTINLIYLLRDRRRTAQNMAMDILKYLLLHRRAALEELLVSKPSQGQILDVLHGGFDKLLTGSSSAFYEWLHKSEQIVRKVLEQCSAIMWVQYIAGSTKFPTVRIKGMEVRRKREMIRRSKEVSKLDFKHFEQMSERRYALELVREAMSTELRVLRQDKYGWVLHAESEWQAHLQQLVHERGIFPVQSPLFTKEPEWQLCPIEGPYRMRKKLECCKLRIETIDDILNKFQYSRDEGLTKANDGYPVEAESNPDSFFHILSGDVQEKGFNGLDYDDSSFKEAVEFNDGGSSSAQIGWNDDRCSSMNEQSLHSALEPGVKSSSFSVQMTESFNGRSDLGSPRQSSSMRIDESKAAMDKPEKELYDNGEYLIRPYLEPFEKIRFRYNCERVVGLDKHDGIFLIGDLCLYVIENFYIDHDDCICEKEFEDELSVIDQALGVKKDVTGSSDFQSKSPAHGETTVKALVGGRAWAYSGGAWGKEKACNSGNLPHLWRMWKLESVHEILKRDYQLRPVAIEIFSMDGCNDLLVFHKREREEVFKNLVAMNLPRNSMLDTTISGSLKQENNERGRLFKIMAKSFSKRWQNGEISNFQYLMHLNTLAGRGYNDLTQYPVFPWVLADYESDTLDLSDPKSFRKLDKPMGCQTLEGEEEFRKRYESWDDPDVPKFHYGSHYSSAGIVLFYLLRLPPFSMENQKLQGGQFDHADRLFNSVRDTWLSASGKGNTSDVKELIPEFFYMPEFLENRFHLDLGEKQSGEKVGDVLLPPWAKGSAREFIRKHREALESNYVSENLHHWIDLIFGFKQRGKAAEEAVNVFYHYTYEGSVDIDSVSDPAMKASILAQINHFGQTPRQLFLKPHPKRRSDCKPPMHILRNYNGLVSHEVRKAASPITQIVTLYEKILIAGVNNLLKPITYSKYIAWGYPDRSLRFISYDQDRLLSTHENLHGGSQLRSAGISHDGNVLVTGGDDGVVSVWRIGKEGNRGQCQLQLKRSLCAHTAKITCLFVSQPYTLIVSGSEDHTVILWDLSGLVFVKQLPEFPAPVSAVYVNDLTGEIVTAAGVLLATWSINGECLAVVNTSQLPSDSILSVTCSISSDWLETNWFVTGHLSGAIKIWRMVYFSDEVQASSETNSKIKSPVSGTGAGLGLSMKTPEYRLILCKVLKTHKHSVTALHLTSDLKHLLSGDSGGYLLSWTLPDESGRSSFNQRMMANDRTIAS